MCSGDTWVLASEADPRDPCHHCCPLPRPRKPSQQLEGTNSRMRVTGCFLPTRAQPDTRTPSPATLHPRSAPPGPVAGPFIPSPPSWATSCLQRSGAAPGPAGMRWTLPSLCPAAAGLASPAGSTATSLRRDFPGNVPSSRVWHRGLTQPNSSLSRRPINGKERRCLPAVPTSRPLPFSTWQHHSWGSFLLCPPTRGYTVTSRLAQKSHCQQDPATDPRTPGSPHGLPGATLSREVTQSEPAAAALTPPAPVRCTETGMDPHTRSGRSSHPQ